MMRCLKFGLTAVWPTRFTLRSRQVGYRAGGFGTTLLMGMILLSLSSSTYAKGAPHCDFKRYPNLACKSQSVRCACASNGKCHWVFDCD